MNNVLEHWVFSQNLINSALPQTIGFWLYLNYSLAVGIIIILNITHDKK